MLVIYQNTMQGDTMKKIKGITAIIVTILFVMSCTQPIASVPDKAPEETFIFCYN